MFLCKRKHSNGEYQETKWNLSEHQSCKLQRKLNLITSEQQKTASDKYMRNILQLNQTFFTFSWVLWPLFLFVTSFLCSGLLFYTFYLANRILSAYLFVLRKAKSEWFSTYVVQKCGTRWNELEPSRTSWYQLEWTGTRRSYHRVALEGVRLVSCNGSC